MDTAKGTPKTTTEPRLEKRERMRRAALREIEERIAHELLDPEERLVLIERAIRLGAKF